jgi:hypothetical protein
MLRNVVGFYCDVSLARRPTPKLEGQLLSAVRDSLTIVLAARSSILNHRTRHPVVTVTRLSPQLHNLTLSLLMLHICGASKTFGEWYQKTNKTEHTNKLTLLAFK